MFCMRHLTQNAVKSACSWSVQKTASLNHGLMLKHAGNFDCLLTFLEEICNYFMTIVFKRGDFSINFTPSNLNKI